MSAKKIVVWFVPVGLGLVTGHLIRQQLSASAAPAPQPDTHERVIDELAGRATTPRAPRDDYSNIYPEDYVGPASCSECHAENHSLWQSHPHSRMNQNAASHTVMGDFSGVEIEYGEPDRRVVFSTEGSRYLMTLYEAGELVREFAVTRVAGSRFNQFYIGVQVQGPEPADDPTWTTECKLPFAYWFGLKRWLPEIYFDSYPPPEDDYDEIGTFSDFAFHVAPEHAWETSCIACHNTYPYVARLRGEGDGWDKGFPDNQIELLDGRNDARWLQWYYEDSAIHANELVTMGISCETCHFGGREHVEGREIRWLPTAPDLRVNVPNGQPADSQNAYVINSICNQCHSADVDRYVNGAGKWNSAEAIDMSNGHCASEIKCTDCHNPHRPGVPGGSPDQPRHINSCLECHAEYQSPAVVAAHTRHAPESVTCLDCHMPRISQGLETVVRSHTISSPSDPDMLAEGSLNACNICHLEESITWTADHLASGWGVDLDPVSTWLEAYDGNLEQPVGRVWLSSDDQPTRLIATHHYSRSQFGPDVLPMLLDRLEEPYAVNRVFGLIAIQEILGHDIPHEDYDLLGTPETRREQVAALREALAGSAGALPSQTRRRVERVGQILDTHCAECHGVHLTRAEGKFGLIGDLETLAADPKWVVPGDADASLLFQAIIHGDMPPEDENTPPMTADEIATLRRWIEDGAFVQ